VRSAEIAMAGVPELQLLPACELVRCMRAHFSVALEQHPA